MNSSNYYESKVKFSIHKLIEKISFTKYYIETYVEQELKIYIYTIQTISYDKNLEARNHIMDVYDDIRNTIKDEMYAINEYIIAGLVDELNLKSDMAEYKIQREMYYNMHYYASDVLYACNHHTRSIIETQVMTDKCSICFKKHSKHLAIKLECGHEFGTKCFNSWSDSCIEQRADVTCAICRKKNV